MDTLRLATTRLLSVPCTRCKAKAGQHCMYFNGHRADEYCNARYRAERDLFLVEQGYEALGVEVTR